MESFRVEAHHVISGKERVVRRNFSSLDECRRWVSENRDMEVVGAGGSYRVPFTSYDIVRITEEVIESE